LFEHSYYINNRQTEDKYVRMRFFCSARCPRVLYDHCGCVKVECKQKKNCDARNDMTRRRDNDIYTHTYARTIKQTQKKKRKKFIENRFNIREIAIRVHGQVP